MKTLLIILASLSLVQCAGSGPNGEFTPADAESFSRAATGFYDVYAGEQERYRQQQQVNPYYQPAPYGY